MNAPGAARTSVFCAVWNQDPNRHDLLRDHMNALSRQTARVTPIYVFDNADEPPSWAEGKIVVSPDPLTIYQAWNIAVQVAETEYVMNLNLDDRLAPDAVALLEDFMTANGAGLAGGDWNICYSQHDTNAIKESFRARTLPFEDGWPPPPGAPTRLGSGTGDRGTLGPATMWRRGLHDQVPFPYLFGDGDAIKIVGDLAWWTVVGKHLGTTAIRLPLVIGNYHSHPADQAEFRGADEHETLGREGVQPQWYPLAGIEIRQERR